MVAPHELGGTRIHLAHVVRSLLVLTAMASPAALAASAQAAFPGENGKIAFTAASSIDTVNPDGSGLTDLTAGQGENLHPAWSPDGRRLAFTSHRDGNYEIYVMNADGSSQQRITFDAATDAEPSWSPDAQRVVFESNRDGNYELYVMDADGSNQARLTNTPQDEASPAWSPDGRKIAFDGGGSTGIFVINADGTGRTRLDTVGTFMPNWSPDGREIWSWWEYYDPINEVTYSDLASYDLETGFDQQGYCTDCDASMPAVSPDNKEVVFTLSGALTVLVRAGGGRQLGVAGDDADWQPIHRGYVRPKGATPTRLSLVPAYEPCTSPNTTHGAPLSAGSCAPPVPESTTAFVGIGDGDPAPARSIGSVLLRTLSGVSVDGSDVGIDVSLTNVMKTSDHSDYAGELRLELPLRITDRANTPSPSGYGPGTVNDTSIFATVPCSATPADPVTGSACALSTTADSLAPATVRAGARAIWQLGKVRLHDGGPDGDADTPADNELFAVQGVFAP